MIGILLAADAQQYKLAVRSGCAGEFLLSATCRRVCKLVGEARGQTQACDLWVCSLPSGQELENLELS